MNFYVKLIIDTSSIINKFAMAISRECNLRQ